MHYNTERRSCQITNIDATITKINLTNCEIYGPLTENELSVSSKINLTSEEKCDCQVLTDLFT